MKNLDTYATLIAKFACVDGGIVLTKDFDLIGFGAQAIVDLADLKPPKIRYITPDNSEDLTRKFNHLGMRHRAC